MGSSDVGEPVLPGQLRARYVVVGDDPYDSVTQAYWIIAVEFKEKPYAFCRKVTQDGTLGYREEWTWFPAWRLQKFTVVIA